MADFTIVSEDSIEVTLGKSDLSISIELHRELQATISGTTALELSIMLNPMLNVGSGGNGTGFVSQAEWLVIEKIAGESISALNLVRFQDANNVVKATNDQTYADAKVTGIALNGASIGGTVRVLIFGIIEDPFFTFPANTLLFLGVDGTITSTPPLSGFSAIIGEAPAVGVVTLSIREPTIL
jgi:hypothetical protein